jgi:purine-binding chemotaxis protein CheW
MSELQIVNFTIGAVNYGVPVEQVREVRDMQAATPVPGSDPCAVGVTNLRGQIITLIDLRKKLNIYDSEKQGEKIIVVESRGHAVGVLVDSVTEVSTIPRKDIDANSELAVGFDKSVVGVAKQGNKLVVVMNLLAALSDYGGQSAAEAPLLLN